jgi:putative holliday junction resolvase
MPADRTAVDAKPPRGVRLGIDLGQVRIGLAASDPDGLLAMPVETVRREPAEVEQGARDLARIVEVVRESGAGVVYVGLPCHLSGHEGAAARAIRTYCGVLAHAIAPVPVRLVDERLTTVTAHQALRASGRPGRRHRQVVDQAAAVVILQSAIDAEREAGGRVGGGGDPPRGRAGGGRGAAGEPGRGGVEGTDRMDHTAGSSRREAPK